MPFTVGIPSWAFDLHQRLACDLRSGWRGTSGRSRFRSCPVFLHLSIYLSTYLSTYLPTYLPTYLSTISTCFLQLPHSVPSALIYINHHIGLHSFSRKTSPSSLNYSWTTNPSSTTSPPSNTTSFFTPLLLQPVTTPSTTPPTTTPNPTPTCPVSVPTVVRATRSSASSAKKK